MFNNKDRFLYKNVIYFILRGENIIYSGYTKKVSCVLVVFLLTSISIGVFTSDLVGGKEISIVSNEQYHKGYRYNIQGWIYVHIEGDPYERGYQHGYLLANEIVDMINRWSNVIHNQKSVERISKGLSESRYQKISEIWWNFCTKQCKRMYWNKFPNEYKQEIEGIADGVNARGGKIHGREINFKDILAINEMYEFMSKFTNIGKGIHPLRTLLHLLKKVEPKVSSIGTIDFIRSFFSGEPPHHCNGFIATGDATTNGQIVFSHSTICGGGTWWWDYYISLRWNVMLDIQPTNGNRVIIPTSPGLIWSDEDYYQNDNGIVFLETTNPQGLYDNIGLPLSVRARNAVQYGNSIDDVVYYLRYKNDGSMNAVWLIGDDKTGEIARFELGYSAYAIWRTFDGFYWSSNNPYDLKVRLEQFKLDSTYLYHLLGWITEKKKLFAYYSIRYIPGNRDLKFEELGNKYYGKIDADIVKEIMHTLPIGGAITDCKVTDSNLLSQNGVWAFFGNPVRTLNYTNFNTNKHFTESVYKNGWVRFFGVPSKEDFELIRQDNDYSTETEVLWKFDTKFNYNDFSSECVIEKDILYTTTSEGKVFAIDARNGDAKWEKIIGIEPTKPVIDNDLMFIGHAKGLSVLNLDGNKKWEVSTDNTVLNPVVVDDVVIFGDDVGNVYALSVKGGEEQWNLQFSDEICISSTYNDNIYIASGKNCYAVSLDDQKISWEFNTRGMITSAPALKDNIVYVASWDNYVYALDANNGDLIWSYETGWGIDTSPAVSKGMVFVGSNDNTLYALNADDGSLEWMFTCNAGIHSSPVVYGDYVFFGSDDGRFYALNTTTGKSVWFFAPGQTIDDDLNNYITTPIVSDSVAHNGAIYLGSIGNIYALDAQTFEQPESKVMEEEIPYETWLFIVLSLLFLILITAFYLYWTRKKVK